jgi:DNA-binding ferritin-like protein
MAKVLGLGLGKGLSMAPSIMRVSMGRDTDEAEDRQEELDFKPDMEAVGDFVGHVLIAAAQVHMLHFQASLYSKHKILNKLYDQLPEDIDSIAEEFQALYENIPSYNSYVSFNQNPIVYVQDLLDFVHENRQCMGPHSSMQSLIDILESTIKSTLYKLKKLN